MEHPMGNMEPIGTSRWRPQENISVKYVDENLNSPENEKILRIEKRQS
jgi:hypothetical protein